MALPGISPALTQTQPGLPAPALAVAPAAPAAPATAAALHRLFAHKRRTGLLLAATTAVAGGLAYGARHANRLEPAAVLAAAGAGAGTLTLVGLLAFERGYSRRREQKALAAWQAHQLPPHLQKKPTNWCLQPAP